MTRGWKVWSTPRESRWPGDTPVWWFAERQQPLHREMAETLDDLLVMVEGYEQHRAARGLGPIDPAVPVR